MHHFLVEGLLLPSCARALDGSLQEQFSLLAGGATLYPRQFHEFFSGALGNFDVDPHRPSFLLKILEGVMGH
jgi:hypothetical protein